MKYSEEGLSALLPKVAGNPAAMVALARHMQAAGKAAEAARLCLQAIETPSCDPETALLATTLLAAGVPNWHFGIVRDAARNEAYDAALRRAVTPGCKVLDIGSGTGLLAMMAARAGAGEVITCEANLAIASVARTIVAHNGYGDRVRVIAKHSRALDVASDLGGPADILVSELFGNDLLGEGTLAVHQHAVARLLKPGAAVIPRRGYVRVALAEDAKPPALELGAVAGFDLAPFNRLAKRSYALPVGDARLTLRSAPADLFVFDFASGGPFHAQRASVTLTATQQPVNGIAQWFALDMDAHGRFENMPGPGAKSSWNAVFTPLAPGHEVRAGQAVEVIARHFRTGLALWAKPA